MKPVLSVLVGGCVLLLASCLPASAPSLFIDAASTRVPASIETPGRPEVLSVSFEPYKSLPAVSMPEDGDKPRTELQIRLVDATGEPVAISKAELLLSAWSEVKTRSLITDGNALAIILEEDATLYPPPYEGKPWSDFRVYIEAEGYAPLESKAMQFFGSEVYNETERVVVDFPNNPALELAEGETQTIDLVVRKPVTRTLHFVDDAGLPVTGVEVDSYLFWSNDNHCGAPSGVVMIDSGSSDESGYVRIPDGDIDYLFDFWDSDYHLQEWYGEEYGFGYPMQMEGFMSEPDTEVRLHRLEKRGLEMTITEDGEPVSNKSVIGQIVYCGCGFCGGEIAVTDAHGKIAIEDFFPEKYQNIFLRDSENNEIIWQSDPKELIENEIISYHVELGSN